MYMPTNTNARMVVEPHAYDAFCETTIFHEYRDSMFREIWSQEAT